MRESDPKLPDKKLIVADNPFGGWGDASKLVLVPAINPDVTVIHVQKADQQGTSRIEGLTFADVEQVKAARKVIITCEELVETDCLREKPDQNQIPFFCVDAVVPVPFGAYPTACFRHYDYDPVYLNDYHQAAQDETRFQNYLKEFVLGVDNQDELIEHVGKDRMDKIKADPRTGYAVGLDRR